MIPGLSTIRLIVWGVAATAVVGAGIYARHIYGEAQEAKQLRKDKIALSAQLENERTQNRIALEKENALQKKLSDARSASTDLLRRLRGAYADLSEVAAGPALPVGTVGTGSGAGEIESLDRAVEEAISACKRDSIRLQGWLDYYESVPAELK